MPTNEEVFEQILSRRTTRDIADLDRQIANLEEQLVNCNTRMVDVSTDRQNLEAAFTLLEGSAKLLPIAHELSEVAEAERRTRGKHEKLERELEDLRAQRARWKAIRNALTRDV